MNIIRRFLLWRNAVKVANSWIEDYKLEKRAFVFKSIKEWSNAVSAVIKTCDGYVEYKSASVDSRNIAETLVHKRISEKYGTDVSKMNVFIKDVPYPWDSAWTHVQMANGKMENPTTFRRMYYKVTNREDK